ncbi:MAG: biotin/lipoyl-binding protein, partial [Boseongicola sp.]|nr:biotin/lipoyl-binding protein [Boseongicola sp.]
CSIQRRNQKVVEEAPSPFLDEETRAAMGKQSCELAKAVGYSSAGTVEFIVDGEKNFYFLEMNTRLQVEHPVTELITGVDLVEQMIRVAYGETLSLKQSDIGINGWSIENRLYAEDPYRGFLPSIGRLSRYRPPAEVAKKTHAVRNDTGVFEGGEISMYYDPMIAKLCTWAPTRADAIEEMRNALDAFEIEGIGHNLPFLAAVMDHPIFIAGDMTTAFIEEQYPDGFAGVVPDVQTNARLAAVAAHVKMRKEARAAQISGGMANHRRRIAPEWVVYVGKDQFNVSITEKNGCTTVAFEDGQTMDVASDWTLGCRLFEGDVGGVPMIVKTDFIRDGARLRYRGADLNVVVRTPRQAELVAKMPEKVPPDTSKMLLCPMPGLIVSIAVEEGQEVQEGQALCTIEAMKMENILRAEKKGKVSVVKAVAGDSLQVDEIIMEFE